MFGSKSFPSVLLAAAHGAVANGVAVFTRAWTILRHRREVHGLLTFDDHMLRDIGITRGDVVAALVTSGTRDPSTRLRVLAVERRAGWRAQRREAMAAFGEGDATTDNPPATQGSLA